MIVILAVAIQLIKDKKLEGTEQPKLRKRLECLLDGMRLVAYSLAYRFIVNVLIGKTKKLQLLYTGYILLALLVLFFTRKLLFWSLFIFKDSEKDLKMWEKRKIK